MDLFEYMSMQRKKEESPLAVRMRPKNLDEVVGQQHIIGKDKLLYRAIKADKISSLIFYGPPGTWERPHWRKVIANTNRVLNFVQMNATTSGKKDMEQAVSQAKGCLWDVWKEKPYYLLMRYIGLIRHSRIIFYHLWKMVQ